jgi:hypothetical protein
MYIVAMDAFEMDELVEVLRVCILSCLLMIDCRKLRLRLLLLLSRITRGRSRMCILSTLQLTRAVAAMTEHVFPVIDLFSLCSDDFLGDFHTILSLMSTASIGYTHKLLL